jgi:cation diffusion facilitator family transporter
MKRRVDFSSPYTCMGIVLAMYLVKVIAKVSIGKSIGSLGLQSDGIHNLADMAEATIILYVIRLSRRHQDEEYPMGRGSLEPFAVGLAGAMLLFMGLGFLGRALLGLIYLSDLAPGVVTWAGQVFGVAPFVALEIGTGKLPLVAGVLAVSVMLSWVVSRYQISLGKELGHLSLVADGKETRSDSVVESGVLAGILCNHFLGLPWIDPAVTLVISFFLLNTSREMLSNSLDIIQNRSVGKELTDRIEAALSSVNEVEGFDAQGPDRPKAFHLGKGVLVSVKIRVSPTMTMDGFQQLKTALRVLIQASLSGMESVVLIRPSVPAKIGARLLLPLISPDFDGEKFNGVIAAEPKEADEWVRVESVGDAARSIRRVGKPAPGEGLADFLGRVHADRIILGATLDAKCHLAAELNGSPCDRVSFITLRDMFH